MVVLMIVCAGLLALCSLAFPYVYDQEQKSKKESGE